jgi:hypothetical protein
MTMLRMKRKVTSTKPEGWEMKGKLGTEEIKRKAKKNRKKTDK